MTIPRFRAVVIDVDSTLCGIEGIDWLAARRGPEVAERIARVTEQAMDGAIPLESVYGERLALIQPTAAEIAELAAAYREALAPGAHEAIFRMRGEGVSVALVSGGIRQAVRPAARDLGFSDGSVHAVWLSFDPSGHYVDYDRTSPLTTQLGKRDVVAALGLARPALAVGDGVTDLAMRESTDAFAAYTGFVRREPVVAAADHVVSSFPALMNLVLP